MSQAATDQGKLVVGDDVSDDAFKYESNDLPYSAKKE